MKRALIAVLLATGLAASSGCRFCRSEVWRGGDAPGCSRGGCGGWYLGDWGTGCDPCDCHGNRIDAGGVGWEKFAPRRAASYPAQYDVEYQYIEPSHEQPMTPTAPGGEVVPPEAVRGEVIRDEVIRDEVIRDEVISDEWIVEAPSAPVNSGVTRFSVSRLNADRPAVR